MWWLHLCSYLWEDVPWSPDPSGQQGLCSCVPQSHGERVLGRLPPAEHCTECRLRQIFLCKRPIYLYWGIRQRGRLWLGISRVLQRCSQGTYVAWEVPSLCCPSASLQFPGISLRHSLGTLIFPCPGTCLDQPALVTSGAHACGPIGLHILAHFRSCCLRVWLLITHHNIAY